MPRPNTIRNRRAFWFRQQGGQCHLRCTDACDAALGVMLIEHPPEHDRAASWDHLQPRNGAKNRSNLKHLVLLACRQCNTKRGHAELSDDSPAWALAAQILAAWREDVQRRDKAARNARAANKRARAA